VALAWALLNCRVNYIAMRLRGPMTPERRAVWLRSACRGVLNSLDIQFAVNGTPARSGLVVSNHLSYLDILIYSAAMPCVFVSKIEVNRWPYFGAAARAGGTIFIDRRSRASAAAVAVEIGERLTHAVPVLVFPEGTSTDGASVLHFHAGLFEPAIKSHAPVTAAAVRYTIGCEIPESELCWYSDAPFLPHLWKALGAPNFRAEVTFAESRVFADRRAAALGTHGEVVRMRDAAVSDAHCVSS
jgi:1-acyl-sn-glycerol-3-phosphate acyltransferase